VVGDYPFSPGRAVVARRRRCRRLRSRVIGPAR
jgi:hypothetical protein